MIQVPVQPGPDLADLAEELREPTDLLESADDAPIIRLINAVISEAIRENASDIHVEPFENRLVVRFRIDGVLREVLQSRRAVAPLVVSRIKVMSKLDIAEKRLPQDGRIELELGYRDNDLDEYTSDFALVPGAQGGLKEYSIMANVLYDIPITERLGFSIGAGAGAGALDAMGMPEFERVGAGCAEHGVANIELPRNASAANPTIFVEHERFKGASPALSGKEYHRMRGES